jgi:hypothetical protein
MSRVSRGPVKRARDAMRSAARQGFDPYNNAPTVGRIYERMLADDMRRAADRIAAAVEYARSH